MPLEYFNTSPKMRTGFIPLDIQSARIVSSTAGEAFASSVAAGYISTATTPNLNPLSTALRVATLTWSSGSAVQVQFPNIVLPPDFSSLSVPTFNVLAGRAAAASSDTSPTWVANIYAGIGSSVALTLPVTNITSSVATQYSGSMTTAALGGSGYPNILTVLINPGSSQDQPRLYGAWIEYTRTLRG